MTARDKAWDHIMQAGGYLMGGDYIACNAHLEAAMKMLVLASLEKTAEEAEHVASLTRSVHGETARDQVLGASVKETRDSIKQVASVENSSYGICYGNVTINNTTGDK